jgi:hypothetical protein
MLILIKNTLVNLSNIKTLEIEDTGGIRVDDEFICHEAEEAKLVREVLKDFSAEAMLAVRKKMKEDQKAQEELLNGLQEEMNRRQAMENPMLMMRPPETKN